MQIEPAGADVSIARTLIIAILLIGGVPGYAGSPKPRKASDASHMHSHLPLGIEGFLLRPAKRMLYVMGTAESPAFEGWHSAQNTILDRDGAPVRFYPERLHFRVTASTILQLIGIESSPLQLDTDTDSFLQRLSFRLKIFHDLHMTTLQPESVQMLGVPAEVSSEERVYGATFSIPRTPIEDHVVLEVLTPEGDRLCRFHLDF